ncbi:hypothetical protein E4U56_000646 [Claviceps arundinis]|uniref:SAP domain-containing protein n=1 Tax=Claviceps arundinis TaxID=1623583 RepID=A0A9P7MU30_9HYPO|nr:hypothetical protein E4U56_000646 [Claviceps arundinis]
MSEWAKLKVVNLKAELKKRGLPQAGLKSELVARIEEFDAAQQAESSHHEPEPAAQGDAPQTANDNDNATHHEEPASNGMAESDVVVEASAAREQDLVGGSDGSNAAEEILQSEDTSAPIEPERAPEAEKEPEQQAPEQEVVHESEQQQPEQAAEHKSEEQRPEQEMKQEPEQQQQQQQPKQEVEQELEQPQQQETEPEPISAPIVDKAPSQDRDPAVTETAQDQDEDVIMEDAGSATEEPQTASFHPESPPRAAPVPVEPSQLESQKRKRRSTSPVPQDEDIARKRARATSLSPVGQHNTPHYLPDVDYDRHVEPSIHPATSALYINNLMRPLRPADLRAHIVALAAAPGSPPDDDIVIKFHLDFIRTHALICLSSVSAASRVRQLLHGRVWPNESNRKALHIDFIPPDKMDSWIAMEESGGRRAATRWEVTYTPSADGSTIHADLVTASLSYSSSSNRPLAPPPSSRLPPSASAILPRDSVNSAPLGPRGYTDRLDAYNTPPTGPRGSGPRRQTATNSPSYQPPGEEQYTHTQPAVAFSLVSEDLAEKRLANMRSYYVRDKRPLGREINRYSFEDGFSFVDRGREIFEGIRPPHRERGGGGGGGGRGGMRGDGGRGRRGGVGGGSGGSSGGYRSRSDRYIPGGGREESYRRRY